MMNNGNNYLASYRKRSLENAIKPTVLECGVCEEVFTLDGDKVPRLLQCGHTVCHSCLLRLKQPTEINFLFCPFDRQPTEFSSRDGIQSLKKNFALIELLDRLEQSSCEKSLDLESERQQSTQPCDEDSSHFAVIYCTVCCTHLCEACEIITHSSKTLGKHRRVPLSEKPRVKPKCPIHTNHIAEFTCVQAGCQNALMCYLCKDYGRHSSHKLALVEIEAENFRKSITTGLQKITQFMESVKDTSRKIEVVIHELENWAIEDARNRVKHHFDELRLQLAEQEKNALTSLDAEMQVRLMSLRQQLEDLMATKIQIADVCLQCEAILEEDDWMLFSSAGKIRDVLASLEQQQQRYSRLGLEFLTPESSVPIIFSRDNRVHIGTKIDMRVVILGLDRSGKTTILSAMKGNTPVTPPNPTIGFNVERLEYENLVITLWDVGGDRKIRPLWKHYYEDAQAVIFVVDAGDKARFQEAREELSKIVSRRQLKDALFLIYANKQDIEDCATIEELSDILSLQKLCCGRAWHVQGSAPLTDPTTTTQGLQWLTQQLGAHEAVRTSSTGLE